MKMAHAYIVGAALVLLLSILLVTFYEIHRQRMQAWVATWPAETFEQAISACREGKQDFQGTDCAYVWAAFTQRYPDIDR